MSIFTGIESFWAATEADVIAVVSKVVAGVEVVEADLQQAFSWLVNNSGTIASDINEVAGAITTVTASGLITNASIASDLATAANAANAAAKGITTAAAAVQAGGTTTAALVAGYQAIVNAQAAAVSAKQVLANAAAAS